MADLISRAAVLDAIEALQHSPWYGDEKDTAYHHRYLTRKEAVEIVRDLAVKNAPTIDAIPVEWLKHRLIMALKNGSDAPEQAIRYVLWLWEQQKDGEQEVQDG